MNIEKSLKTVLVSSFIHEIHVAHSKLASKNIQSYVVDENLNSIIGTAFVEGYKLKVDAVDYEKARSILCLYKV